MKQNTKKIDNVVIIDSNFILLPFQFKIDYLADIALNLEGTIRFVLFKQVIDELKAKERQNPKDVKFHTQFNSGLSYLKKNDQGYDITYMEDIKDKNETTDNFLIKKSNELKETAIHVFLATNDSELRKKAKISKLGTIFMRQKKYLCFEGF